MIRCGVIVPLARLWSPRESLSTPTDSGRPCGSGVIGETDEVVGEVLPEDCVDPERDGLPPRRSRSGRASCGLLLKRSSARAVPRMHCAAASSGKQQRRTSPQSGASSQHVIVTRSSMTMPSLIGCCSPTERSRTHSLWRWRAGRPPPALHDGRASSLTGAPSPATPSATGRRARRPPSRPVRPGRPALLAPGTSGMEAPSLAAPWLLSLRVGRLGSTTLAVGWPASARGGDDGGWGGS